MDFLYALLIIFVGYIAYKKQRNVIGWLVLAVLILPFAVIGILLLKPLTNREERTKQNNFSSFGLDWVFLGRIKYPAIIIGITALFAFLGYIYTMLKYAVIDRLNDNVMGHIFYQALMEDLDGDALDYDSIYSLTSFFINGSTSASYYMQMIIKEQMIQQSVLGGAIGLLLAIGIILMSSNRNAKIATSFVSKLKEKLQPFKKQIIFTVLVIVGSTLILGNAAYFIKKVSIDQDSESYFAEVITDPVTGENLYDELYYLGYEFPANNYLFVMEGLSIYEANLKKDTFTFIGLLLGLAIVVYRFKKQTAK